jgi:hypothetical protein
MNRSIERATRERRYFVGLDLGQAADFTALAILERQPRQAGTDAPVFHCRHLQRWPLRTSYPSIVSDVALMIDSSQMNGFGNPVLAVDATGVGAPVVDLFKRAQLKARLMPIQITGGDSISYDNGVIRVPKRDLVSVTQVALQSERLKIASELPEASTLIREMQNFHVKINIETAHDSYGAWREGTHDDLVLAVALALWTGVHRGEPDIIPVQPLSYAYSYLTGEWK